MSEVVPLIEARDPALYGSKAAGLGQALRDGLPVPPGVALTGDVVDAVASRDEQAMRQVMELVRPLGGPLGVDRAGNVLERTAGRKSIVIRSLPEGGTVEEEVAPELVERLCLEEDQLAELGRLADRCEEVYGRARDIEWAVAGGTLYLLQCRAVTTSAP